MDRQSDRIVSADGRERTLSWHVLNSPHPEVTIEDIAYVLDHWGLRGVYTNPRRRRSWSHYALVPRVRRVVRVAVSMDDQVVITAFIDGAATGHWERGNIAYFSSRLRDMETRDEFDGNV